MKKIIIALFTALLSMGWTGFAGAVAITDTVLVDGKEWAQVDLFTGLTWNNMNAVCPGGVCGAGTLNGYDMLGWTWASTEMVNNLFNHYIGNPPQLNPGSFTTGDPHMGPGPDEYAEGFYYPNPFVPDPNTGAFARAFFADGWRPTQHLIPGDTSETVGLLSDTSSNVGLLYEGGAGGAYTNMDTHTFVITYGGWFQRNDVAIPAPATLPLLAAALAGLGWFRRKA